MDKLLERMLKELNYISRVAILEEAYDTEKMLCAYIKYMKYIGDERKSPVLLRNELDAVLHLCHFYKTKWRSLFSFHIKDFQTTKDVLVPHASIVSYVSMALEELDGHTTSSLDLTIQAKKQQDLFIVEVHFQGNIAFEQKWATLEQKNKKSYDTVKQVTEAWHASFNQPSICVTAQDGKGVFIVLKGIEKG